MKVKWYSPFWTLFPFPVHVTFLKPMKSFVSGILERQREPTTFTAGGGQGVWGAPRAEIGTMFLGDLPPFPPTSPDSMGRTLYINGGRQSGIPLTVSEMVRCLLSNC